MWTGILLLIYLFVKYDVFIVLKIYENCWLFVNINKKIGGGQRLFLYKMLLLSTMNPLTIDLVAIDVDSRNKKSNICTDSLLHLEKNGCIM